MNQFTLRYWQPRPQGPPRSGNAEGPGVEVLSKSNAHVSEVIRFSFAQSVEICLSKYKRKHVIELCRKIP